MNCAPVEVEGTVSSYVITLQTVEKIMEAEHEIRKRIHRAGFVAKYSFSNILYTGGALADAVKNAMDFSAVDSNILIRGKNGTGKELFAQSIHSASSRRNKPFVAINCAALPDNILWRANSSAMWRGPLPEPSKAARWAFSRSPTRVRSSWTRSAISPPKLQSQLLRPSGAGDHPPGQRYRHPHRRAHHRCHQQGPLCRGPGGPFPRGSLLPPGCAGTQAPPIRQRKQDLPCLIGHFLDLEREKHACALRDFTPEALALLSSYDWPGNIREIRNFCERVSILCRQETAGAADVLRALPNLTPVPSPEPPAGPEEEREALRQALLLHQGSRKETALALGHPPHHSLAADEASRSGVSPERKTAPGVRT